MPRPRSGRPRAGWCRRRAPRPRAGGRRTSGPGGTPRPRPRAARPGGPARAACPHPAPPLRVRAPCPARRRRRARPSGSRRFLHARVGPGFLRARPDPAFLRLAPGSASSGACPAAGSSGLAPGCSSSGRIRRLLRAHARRRFACHPGSRPAALRLRARRFRLARQRVLHPVVERHRGGVAGHGDPQLRRQVRRDVDEDVGVRQARERAARARSPRCGRRKARRRTRTPPAAARGPRTAT